MKADLYLIGRSLTADLIGKYSFALFAWGPFGHKQALVAVVAVVVADAVVAALLTERVSRLSSFDIQGFEQMC